MDVTIKIKRYNPDKQAKSYWQTFNVKDIEPTDQILDVLHRVKWEQDGTLTLRRSCAHGVCGSDAMRINGYNRLACKTLVQDTGASIQVEPINGLPVRRDLVVDMEPFFDHYRSVMPYFVNNNPVPADGRERLQSQEDRMTFDNSTKCILCACCTTSCPSFWANDRYVGPAAIVQAHRFIFDTRDEGNAERIEVLSAPDGVWRCRTIFNCTPACPRDIEVTRVIGEVKLAIQRNGKTDGIVQISEIH